MMRDWLRFIYEVLGSFIRLWWGDKQETQAQGKEGEKIDEQIADVDEMDSGKLDELATDIGLVQPAVSSRPEEPDAGAGPEEIRSPDSSGKD